MSVNWIDTPQGSFRTELVVARVNYSLTPRMFFSVLLQDNSASNMVSNNLQQPAPAVGLLAWERAVRREYGGPPHRTVAAGPILRTSESWVRR